MAINLAKLYPSVVPEASADELGEGPRLTLEIGESMIAILVEDFDDAIENVLPDDVKALGLPEDDVWDRAYQNLGELFRSGDIPVQIGTRQTGETTAIVGPHWLASSMLSSPGLQEYFCGRLGATALLAHLPGRDFVVFTPHPCSEEISSEAADIVKRLQGDLPNPWVDLSFVFTQDGLQRWSASGPDLVQTGDPASA